MSRGAKAGLAVAGAVIAINVALSAVHSLTGGTPGGPASSSYSTSSGGIAAYASLLGRSGHDVQRLRASPAGSHLDPASTLMLIAPDTSPSRADTDALRRFLVAGGRLVVGGPVGSWLGRVVPLAPEWSGTAPRAVDVLAPVSEVSGVHTIEGSGYGSWTGGGALPVLGDRNGALLDVATVGRGHALLLADSAVLDNALLAHADNAALGLALAGPRERPVAFLESYHGYGRSSTGFGAIPRSWWTGFALLAAAAATLMVASGRRFGPPQQTERELPPPRREYVESLGGVLARGRGRAAIEPLRLRGAGLVRERARLGNNAGPDRVRAAAINLGLTQREAAALTEPAVTDEDVIAVGRAVARITRESRS